MGILQTLIVPLTLDPTKYLDGLNKVKGETDTSLSKLGSSLTSTGKKLTLGLTTPILGAGLAAVNFASDMNESLSKVEVVFKDSSDRVKEFADNATESFGISKQGALDALGVFGNLFTSMELNTGI